MPFVPTFGARFHEMVSAGHDCIGWSEDGETCWVSNPERLARDIIPKYFGHSSYASLTRSLHAHSFNKITSNNIWSHPSFRRDSPALAKTITRKRPRPAKAAAPPTEGLGLPPLVAGGAALASSSNGASSDDEASGGNPSAAAKAPRLRFAPETPSPEVAARLAALREQLRAEKQAAKTLQETLDRLEDSSTKARREELQLRLLVVHLASVLATAAAATAPVLAAATAARTLMAQGQLPAPLLEAASREEGGSAVSAPLDLLSLCDASGPSQSALNELTLKLSESDLSDDAAFPDSLTLQAAFTEAAALVPVAA